MGRGPSTDLLWFTREHPKVELSHPIDETHPLVERMTRVARRMFAQDASADGVDDLTSWDRVGDWYRVHLLMAAEAIVECGEAEDFLPRLAATLEEFDDLLRAGIHCDHTSRATRIVTALGTWFSEDELAELVATCDPRTKGRGRGPASANDNEEDELTTNKKDMDELVGVLRDSGYKVAMSRNGHWKVSGGNRPTFLPTTPSDFRGMMASVMQLRRNGYEFSFQGKHYVPRKGDTTTVEDGPEDGGTVDDRDCDGMVAGAVASLGTDWFDPGVVFGMLDGSGLHRVQVADALTRMERAGRLESDDEDRMLRVHTPAEPEPEPPVVRRWPALATPARQVRLESVLDFAVGVEEFGHKEYLAHHPDAVPTEARNDVCHLAALHLLARTGHGRYRLVDPGERERCAAQVMEFVGPDGFRIEDMVSLLSDYFPDHVVRTAIDALTDDGLLACDGDLCTGTAHQGPAPAPAVSDAVPEAPDDPEAVVDDGLPSEAELLDMLDRLYPKGFKAGGSVRLGEWARATRELLSEVARR